MKKFTSMFLSVVMMLLLAVPQAKAIITDPDDYLIFDSGILADSTNHAAFLNKVAAANGMITWSTGVEMKAGGYTVGRSFAEDYIEDYGFKPGTKVADIKNTVEIGALVIPQRKDVADASGAVVERFSTDYAGYLKMSADEKKLPWTYNKGENIFKRPSDSIIIRVPKTCDSIYVQALGSNTGYAIMAYEVGVGEVIPLSGKAGDYHGFPGVKRTNAYYNGGNWGAVREISFKPKHVGPGDSTTIILLAPSKDNYADNTRNNLTHFTKDNSATKVAIYTGDKITNDDGTVRDRYVTCERWGLWEGNTINRIKVYGKIEKGDVPVFDGTHSAFTFSYQPKNSGTVDLTKPLKKENGWSSTSYIKYASDLGVVRSVLTASSYINLGYDEDFDTFAAKLKLVGATHDSVDYTVPDMHNNYFNLAAPTTAFQDLTLDFDYALRGSNNSIIVTAFINGDATCTVLDTLDNSADPNKQMAHASIAIPNTFANQKNFVIRIMVGKGSVSSAAEFDIANLAIKGYKDFYASKDGAVKVAYLTPAVDRIHVMDLSTTADSADNILPYLLTSEDFTTSIIAKDVWSTFTSDEEVVAAFKDYQVVMASPYMTAEDLSFAKALIGKKAFLNTNAQAFLNWNTNAQAVAEPLDSAMIYAEEFFYHPAFTSLGLSADTNAVPNFFNKAVAGVKVPATDKAYILATLNASGAAALYEDYSNANAKYIFLDMNVENSRNITGKGKQLLVNLLNYLKNGGNFAKPSFELISTGAIVENTAQLLDAANYDYGVLNQKSPVISMKTSTDANGIYDITSGISYGGNSITFQPNSSSDNVIIKGALTDTTRMNVSNLTFKNITFQQAEGQTELISLNARVKAGRPARQFDKMSGELKFDGCNFSGIGGKFIAVNGDSVTLKTLTVNNCLFDGANNLASLVTTEGNVLNCNKIAIKENRFYDVATTLVDWKGVAKMEFDTNDEDGDEVLSIEIANNTFRNKTAAAAMPLVVLPEKQLFDSVAVVVNNNLFYNTGKLNVDLFQADTVTIYLSTKKDVAGMDSIVGDTIAFHSNINLDKNYCEGSAISLNAGENWAIAPYAAISKADLGIENIFEDAEMTQISKMSPLFTAGVVSGLNRAYIGAAANYVARQAGDATIFTVKNAQELKTALELAIGGDIIELETNTEDSLGVYQMGQTGFAYPTTGGKLIIRAAEGHKPVIFGNIAPSNTDFKLDELLIDNLTFADPTLQDSIRITGYGSDRYSPFYFAAQGGYIGLMHITNSTFSDLEMQAAIRTNKPYNTGTKTGLYIGKILMDYNTFNNFGGNTADGKVAYHFIQFDVNADYTLSNFTFVENIVKNFHGSQMFNISRSGALVPGDSTMNIVISNNVFYKVGGNAADKYRNFLEFNKTPEGYTVNIDITNNIFYKRWTDVETGQYPLGQLDLFDGSLVKAYNINILKNYYEGEYYYGSDETYGANPMALSGTEPENNLALSATSAVEVNRDKALTWEDFVDYFMFDEDTEDFAGSIDANSEFFTAGVAHPYNAEYKYIGVALCYGIDPIAAPVAVEKVKDAAKYVVFSNNGKLFVNVAEKAQADIYHISGAKVASKALAEGMNEIDNLSNGMYILSIDGQMVKVLVR